MADNLAILVVDDDRIQVDLLSEYLRLVGRFRTAGAQSIRQAWEQLAAQPFDLILLDYRLGDGSGLEFLDQLSARGYHLPVVMVTGQGDEQIAVQAIRQGAMDYLVKDGQHLPTLPALIHKAVNAYQLRRAVASSQEKLHYQALLLSNVRDAVVVWDLAGQITYWNPIAEGLFGWSAAEMLGQPVSACYLNRYPTPVRLPTLEDTLVETERQFQTRQGGELWVSARLSILRDQAAGAPPIGYMDVARDITHRKHMETKIQVAQTRLAQAARLAAIGELAAGVAHQINNPLTTIIAEAQILLQSLPGDAEVRESAAAIEQAGWRAQSVVQTLADFSQPAPRALIRLDVNLTITNALILIGERLLSEGITIQATLAPNLPRIQGYRQHLEDLWINLLLFTRNVHPALPSRQVAIRSRSGAGGWVIVEVLDPARVLPPDQLAALFEPNFLRPAGDRGTGMELSICREIVRQHQGTITVESLPGAGTTFWIMLPLEVVE
jgi:PAS domain S-box-containing protein